MRVGLYWYQIPNVGDMLNPLMLKQRIFPKLVTLDPLDPVPVDRVLLGVGSVLGIKAQTRCRPSVPRIVWGSGYQYEAPRPLPDGSLVKCVRGTWTCERFHLPFSFAVADPAILVPLYWPKLGEPTKTTGRFLRWDAPIPTDPDTHTTRIEEDGLEAWLVKLWSYQRVECDSLHAAILADAYGIPWKPLRWEPKWLDHFGQLGISQKPTDFTTSNRELLGVRAVRLLALANEIKELMT
jgi:hypothetical protein